MMKKLNGLLTLTIVIWVCSVSSLYAGEQGHYTPAPMAVRDFVMPPKGLYFLNYNTYYNADTFKDPSGNELNAISVSGTTTRNVGVRGRSIPITVNGNLNIDLVIDVDVFAQALGLAFVTDKKIFGADYGFIILPSWGHTSVQVNANANAAGTISVGPLSRTLSAGRTIEIKDDKTGLGDLFIQPLWLGWHGKHYYIGLSWSAYLPIGAYDADDIANVGYGFFTSQTQATFYYYPFENKATAFMLTPTWEIHSNKKGADIKPGQNFTIEYGIGQYLHERFEVGVSGFHQWQITEDSGNDAVNTNVKDRINGVAGQFTWWAVKDKCALVGKYVHEYGPEDRLEGWFGQINLTWIF
jgi:hypothetical protein